MERNQKRTLAALAGPPLVASLFWGASFHPLVAQRRLPPTDAEISSLAASAEDGTVRLPEVDSEYPQRLPSIGGNGGGTSSYDYQDDYHAAAVENHVQGLQAEHLRRLPAIDEPEFSEDSGFDTDATMKRLPEVESAPPDESSDLPELRRLPEVVEPVETIGDDMLFAPGPESTPAPSAVVPENETEATLPQDTYAPEQEPEQEFDFEDDGFLKPLTHPRGVHVSPPAEAQPQAAPLEPIELSLDSDEPQELDVEPQVASQVAPDQVKLDRRWLEASRELESVERQARIALKTGYDLALKGALYSARSEFVQSLRAVSRALDTHYHDDRHTTYLLEALQALKEADDFAPRSGGLETRLDVVSLSRSHRTPVLHSETKVTPAIAMQRYYTFAQNRLAAAVGGAPVASETMMALGKTMMALSEKSAENKRLFGPKAIVFHAAAVTVDPANYLAANELGVLYARFGQLEKSRDVLLESLNVRPISTAWQNLATVHERLGEKRLAELARLESRQVPAQTADTTEPMVRWVDVETFVRAPADQADAPSENQPTEPVEQARRASSNSLRPW